MAEKTAYIYVTYIHPSGKTRYRKYAITCKTDCSNKLAPLDLGFSDSAVRKWGDPPAVPVMIDGDEIDPFKFDGKIPVPNGCDGGKTIVRYDYVQESYTVTYADPILEWVYEDGSKRTARMPVQCGHFECPWEKDEKRVDDYGRWCGTTKVVPYRGNCKSVGIAVDPRHMSGWSSVIEKKISTDSVLMIKHQTFNSVGNCMCTRSYDTYDGEGNVVNHPYTFYGPSLYAEEIVSNITFYPKLVHYPETFPRQKYGMIAVDVTDGTNHVPGVDVLWIGSTDSKIVGKSLVKQQLYPEGSNTFAAFKKEGNLNLYGVASANAVEGEDTLCTIVLSELYEGEIEYAVGVPCEYEDTTTGEIKTGDAEVKGKTTITVMDIALMLVYGIAALRSIGSDGGGDVMTAGNFFQLMMNPNVDSVSSFTGSVLEVKKSPTGDTIQKNPNVKLRKVDNIPVDEYDPKTMPVSASGNATVDKFKKSAVIIPGKINKPPIEGTPAEPDPHTDTTTTNRNADGESNPTTDVETKSSSGGGGGGITTKCEVDISPDNGVDTGIDPAPDPIDPVDPPGPTPDPDPDDPGDKTYTYEIRSISTVIGTSFKIQEHLYDIGSKVAGKKGDVVDVTFATRTVSMRGENWKSGDPTHITCTNRGIDQGSGGASLDNSTHTISITIGSAPDGSTYTIWGNWEGKDSDEFGTLTVTIVDAFGNLLPSATTVISGVGTYNGAVVKKTLAPGSYVLTISAPGYYVINSYPVTMDLTDNNILIRMTAINIQLVKFNITCPFAGAAIKMNGLSVGTFTGGSPLRIQKYVTFLSGFNYRFEFISGSKYGVLCGNVGKPGEYNVYIPYVRDI